MTEASEDGQRALLTSTPMQDKIEAMLLNARAGGQVVNQVRMSPMDVMKLCNEAGLWGESSTPSVSFVMVGDMPQARQVWTLQNSYPYRS